MHIFVPFTYSTTPSAVDSSPVLMKIQIKTFGKGKHMLLGRRNADLNSQ